MDKNKVAAVIIGVVLIIALAIGIAACNKGNNSAASAVAAGDIIQMGGYDWRVLEVSGKKALVLSDKVLFRMKYQLPTTGQDFYTSSISLTWDECSLRQYLNEEFFNSAFSAEEKKRIVDTTLINNNNPLGEYGEGGSDTTDKVFLLSIEEVLQYFSDSGVLAQQEILSLVDYQNFINDQFNEIRIAQTQDGEIAWWWLRSPGANHWCEGPMVLATSVTKAGSVYVLGEYVTNENGGVRPALWLKL